MKLGMGRPRRWNIAHHTHTIYWAEFWVMVADGTIFIHLTCLIVLHIV